MASPNEAVQDEVPASDAEGEELDRFEESVSSPICTVRTNSAHLYVQHVISLGDSVRYSRHHFCKS